MAWFSLLPPAFASYETWVGRFFIFLGIIVIGPWAFLIVYDFILFVCRSMWHEVPVVGGRAKGRQRPRAPSLTERPGGSARSFPVRPTSRGSMSNGSSTGQNNQKYDGTRKRSGGVED